MSYILYKVYVIYIFYILLYMFIYFKYKIYAIYILHECVCVLHFMTSHTKFWEWNDKIAFMGQGSGHRFKGRHSLKAKCIQVIKRL